MITLQIVMDDHRLRAFAGLMVLEVAVNDDAWALFWRSVMVARSKYELGVEDFDGSPG